MAKAPRKPAKKKPVATKPKKCCGLCGKSGKLFQTECCGNWICDDSQNYVMFSYAHNSCHRNHDRYTICAIHHHEGHDGDWKTCEDCLKNFDTEMYVYYATNDHNFEKLENPPTYEPTKCGKCGKVIKLAEEGYSMKGSKYYCSRCFSI